MDINFSLIAAIDDQNGIGLNNQLLCYVSEDLKRFKKITTGHTIIMGKNTFLSLPNGALPNRKNIVLSTSLRDDDSQDITLRRSLDEVVANCNDDEEYFIIGGEQLYRLFLPVASRLYLTRIHQKFEADAFFPSFEMNDWNVEEESEVFKTKDEIAYSFVNLVRK